MTEGPEPVPNPFSLAGRNAVVTGAARGIGFAVASRMLEGGANVVVNDIDGGALKAAVDRMDDHGHRVVPVCADASDRTQIADLVRETVDELGSLDILVNNAGVYEPTPLDRLDPAVVDRMVDVNVKGVLYLSAAAAEVMAPGSVIVHIWSLGGVSSAMRQATVVVFLASPAARFMTGQMVLVDGGVYLA
ncbi:MAG: SDR family NAD(P)-dependent oxidoreductase, partial [Acidimicrobiales bacterium]